MEKKKTEFRSISHERQWYDAIEKEDRLRLKWFKKNEERLEEIANQDLQRKVPDEIKEELVKRIMNNVKVRDSGGSPEFDIPPIVDEGALHSIMRPVEKEVKELIYNNIINEGRKTYLAKRCKKIPELRYYFPETTNFNYGWNMWELIKKIRGSPFARQQVIRESFYRRRGVERDPEWYKEPARLSPQVCGRF